jgi:hypothetical protein
MSKHVCICSLSSSWDSNLMWAHYAQSYQGVCIGFELDESEFEVIGIDNVNYQDSKIALPMNFIELDEVERQKYYKEVSYTKSKEWEYEKEVRILSDISDCSYHKELSRFYHTIDIKDVKELYIGINFQRNDLYEKVFFDSNRNFNVFSIKDDFDKFDLDRSSEYTGYAL